MTTISVLTQTYVAYNKVTNIERHHKDENEEYHIKIKLPVEIPRTVETKIGSS